jgi:hypothetical protein
MLIHSWDAALEKPTVPSTLEEPEMTVEGYEGGLLRTPVDRT